MLRLDDIFRKGTEIIVLYSGGKDSTYTLLKLCESGLFHIHALTFDNGYLKEEAKINIESFSKQNNIQHHYLTPDMQLFHDALRICKKEFRKSDKYLSYFERNGVFCWPCFSFLYNAVYDYACHHNIKYIFGGWNPGQIAEGKHKTEEDGQIPYTEVYQAFVRPYIEFMQANNVQTSLFHTNINTSVKIVPYFFFETYNKENIKSYILDRGWIKPEKCESCTTNCELNLADRFLYRNYFGIDRYERQIQKMIEKGLYEPEERLWVNEELLDEDRANRILEGISNNN